MLCLQLFTGGPYWIKFELTLNGTPETAPPLSSPCPAWEGLRSGLCVLNLAKIIYILKFRRRYKEVYFLLGLVRSSLSAG